MQPQQQLEAGALDLGIQGALQAGSMVTIPVEFKLAHNPDLAKGLATQLPEYMRSLGVDNGVLAILSLKGKDFDEPKETLDQLQTKLDDLSYKAKWGAIRVLVLDLGRHEPPSRKY